MADAQDLAARKAALAAVEAEIADEEARFEESIAPLRAHAETLRREYADTLRAELAAISGARIATPRVRRDLSSILAAIESGQQQITVARIRELASRYVATHRNGHRDDAPGD